MLDACRTGPGDRPAGRLRSAAGLFALPVSRIQRRESRLAEIEILPALTGREDQRTLADDVSP